MYVQYLLLFLEESWTDHRALGKPGVHLPVQQRHCPRSAVLHPDHAHCELSPLAKPTPISCALANLDDRKSARKPSSSASARTRATRGARVRARPTSRPTAARLIPPMPSPTASLPRTRAAMSPVRTTMSRMMSRRIPPLPLRLVLPPLPTPTSAMASPSSRLASLPPCSSKPAVRIEHGADAAEGVAIAHEYSAVDR
jgi:hypothetical protein